MSQDRLNELNQHVSEAINAAERMTDQSSVEAKESYLKVSRLEEQIAELVPASDVQGAIARRGAVRAAMNAGDERRAIGLAATYARTGADETLARELQELLKR